MLQCAFKYNKTVVRTYTCQQILTLIQLYFAIQQRGWQLSIYYLTSQVSRIFTVWI